MRVTRLLRFAAKPAKPSAEVSKKAAVDHTGRWKVSGLTLADMKKHYAIVPMFGFTFLAMCLAGGYVYRLASKHPEVSWTKKTSEPWNEYKNKQYKFLDSGRDYSKGSPSPGYKG